MPSTVAWLDYDSAARDRARLAFGQPRQEDLLEFLMARKADLDGESGAAPEGRRISLEPPEVA